MSDLIEPAKEQAQGQAQGHNQGPGRYYDRNLDEEQPYQDPWSIQNILSFDGGGVRGLWSLFVIEKLMKLIARLEIDHIHGNGLNSRRLVCSSFLPHNYPPNVSQEPLLDRTDEHVCCRKPEAQRFLPCHYFDLISGSSTGALIAIMLGRMRMPVSDCIMEYKNLGGEVFGHPRPFHLLRPFFGSTIYSTQKFEKTIQDFVNRRLIGDTHRFKSKSDLCKTMVTSQRTSRTSEISEPYLFRSYRHIKRRKTDTNRANTDKSLTSMVRKPTDQTTNTGDRKPFIRVINYGDASRHEIWQVARAATAPPPYFKPFDLPDGYSYKDGGMSPNNNSTREAITDVKERTGRDSIGTVVNIGTSRKDLPERSSVPGIVSTMIARATNPEVVHQYVGEMSTNELTSFAYWRFNADPRGSEALTTPFDEWKPRPTGAATIKKIRHSFTAWYESDGVSDSLQECATRLVEIKRERARLDSARWERFVTGHFFNCRMEGCQHKNDRDEAIYGKEEFEQHLIKNHGMQKGSSSLNREIEECEEGWEYKSAGAAKMRKP